ncbi:uncharacterized protein [Amphiura filiformis]|uniref:uncharacterized protein n=1 Tax=Amphiura filiformis TaxID=82378 RepID=UPI003B2213F8
MRNRNEEAMVSRPIYQRSTSYDKAMANDLDDDDEEEDQSEKMKSKLMSMWNNMKYGWTVKSKTAFSLQKPIWFLGNCYQHRPSDPEPVLHPGMETVKSPQMELFKQDFTSRLWMTYRREFPQLEGSTLTTDCGWGCMLRSGQMLLAQCLVTHFLGRDWNIYKEQAEEQDKYHHEIIRWFGDQPSDMSPFSIHRLVNVGKSSGKKAGDWYGPASVAHILRDAMETAPDMNPLFEQVCIYVAQDCTVYKQDVIDQCRNRYQGSPKPTYKDRPPTPHVSKRSETQHHDAPDNQSSQHAIGSSRETLINGHHNVDRSHDSSHTASDMNQREKTVHDGMTSQNAIPQKQTMYIPRGERTVAHNAFGYSASANVTRYHRSTSSCANSSVSNNSFGKEKRTKSESDVGGVCRLTETVEHPICRRNAVKELKQGAGWSGSYNKSEPKSPVKTEHKWNWAESRYNSQTSSHGTSGHDHSSHNASGSTHSSHTTSSQDHQTYGNHSHHPSGQELHSHHALGHGQYSYNASVHGQNVPSQSASGQRPEQVSHNASLLDQDPLSLLHARKQNSQPLSNNLSRLKTDPLTHSAPGHSQNLPTHNASENGHEPIWRRRSEDYQSAAQFKRSSQSQNHSQCSREAQFPRSSQSQSSQSQCSREAQFKRNSQSQTIQSQCSQEAQFTRKSQSQCSQEAPFTRSRQSLCSRETEISGAADERTQSPCHKKSDEQTTEVNKKWCALVLLVPVRLGGDEVNPIYVNPLRSLFTLESCMGIIGGKPKHSLYYVGFQDEKMIHLDPHYCQGVVDMKSRKFPTYTFHCMSPRKMRITSMDPSCTVGFYLKTEEDFEEFCKTIPEVVTPAQSNGDYPMFIVRDGHCSDWQESSSSNDSDSKKDRYLRIRHIDEDGRLLAPMKESEDFVFLES